MQENNIIIEDTLSQYEYVLGKEFETYRNHVYRIFNICTLIDSSSENQLKYAIAAIFHDLGIWTDKTFDYLEPSIALAEIYLVRIGKIEWLNEIKLMIDMHHKRSKYRGEYENTVETFRKADWIDVTKGRKSFGFNSEKYLLIVKSFPYLGLHKFLILQTFKNFIKSPFNPLPMFKK